MLSVIMLTVFLCQWQRYADSGVNYDEKSFMKLSTGAESESRFILIRGPRGFNRKGKQFIDAI